MTPVSPLRFTDVGKSLAGKGVLHDVSFSCPSGTITALLGPNAAGKTTVVAVATGLRGADSGRVDVFGRPVRERDARRRFSLVPQEISLPAAVTVRRCLAFVARQRGASSLAPPESEICERLGIARLLERRTGGLSGGQQRRVAVALGLLRTPGLLIMDEATTNLDESTRATTWRMLREYVERGGTALVTSHILADVESHADRIVALNNGRVVLQSPLGQVRQRLGGSTVSIKVSIERRRAVIARVSACHPEAVLVSSDDRLLWRTRDPLRLTAAIAEVAPDGTDLSVQSMPLAEILEHLPERAYA